MKAKNKTKTKQKKTKKIINTKTELNVKKERVIKPRLKTIIIYTHDIHSQFLANLVDQQFPHPHPSSLQ